MGAKEKVLKKTNNLSHMYHTTLFRKGWVRSLLPLNLLLHQWILFRRGYYYLYAFIIHIHMYEQCKHRNALHFYFPNFGHGIMLCKNISCTMRDGRWEYYATKKTWYVSMIDFCSARTSCIIFSILMFFQGTSNDPVQENLRWGVDWNIADRYVMK